jgi:hypothetical protein
MAVTTGFVPILLAWNYMLSPDAKPSDKVLSSI